MKRNIVALLAIAVLFAACGGSGNSGGGTTPTATSEDVAQTVNAAVASTIQILLDDDPSSSVSAEVACSKTLSPFSCTWYDQNDNAIAAEVGNLGIVAKWECPSDCDPSGTQTITISNTLGTPFFAGTPFADGIVNAVNYDSCGVETICGPATLDGTLTITGTGFLTNPCAATITVVSNDMTVDGTVSSSVNMTLNITASGDCSTITTIDCDTNLDDSSTMTVDGTTYDKDDICDMIDNPTC